MDFVVPVRGRPPLLVQVCETLAEPRTRKREITALQEAMAELGQTSGTIVTRHEEERIETGNGTIQVLPGVFYWRCPKQRTRFPPEERTGRRRRPSDRGRRCNHQLTRRHRGRRCGPQD